MALASLQMHRKKPIVVAVAEVLDEPYVCNNPGQEAVVVHSGEFVVNPGTDGEYPITRERLAELYEEENMQKPLDVTSMEDVQKKVSDVKVFGNPGAWVLLGKASSEPQGWMNCP